MPEYIVARTFTVEPGAVVFTVIRRDEDGTETEIPPSYSTARTETAEQRAEALAASLAERDLQAEADYETYLDERAALDPSNPYNAF
jgi:hypothetical protein